MEFDLTTFFLEALNFLILVWLLKRFFYRPVLDVIEKRQAATEQTVAEAHSLREEAETLKEEYQSRLAQVEKELSSAKERLNEELANERERRLKMLESDVAIERKRREALEERHKSERERQMEQQALGVAGRFVTRVFERLSSPHLSDELTDLAIRELAILPDEKKLALKAALHDTGSLLKVISAYPMAAERRSILTQALSDLAQRPLIPEFSEEASLKAGICIIAGSWVLMANLRDELSFFTENVEHGRF